MAIKVRYVHKTPYYEMYDRCTLLYDPETERGLAVVELCKSQKHSMFWYDCVKMPLLNDVLNSPILERIFEGKAEKVGPSGQYPTIGIRQLRHALGLTNPPRESWEKEHWN